MIVDIHGKKLVFGMQWRTLTGSGTPTTLAANIAREVKAARIWHEDQALHMGYLNGADAQAKIKDKLYSAAAALSRVPELVPNALFVFRLDHSGGAPLYLVCGIVKGRPRVGFDQVVTDERTLSTLIADFPTKCDGEFKLVGNSPELLSLLPQDRRISHVEFDLAKLVEVAGPSAVLKKPRATTQRKQLLIVVMVSAVAAVGWKYGKSEYDAYQRRLHPPPPQKTPAELYADDLLSRGAAPVAPAAAGLPAFMRWFETVAQLSVGGWTLSNVKCNQLVSPDTGCTVTYAIKDGARGATNRTFLEAIPDWASNPRFQKGDTEVEVDAKVRLGDQTRLGDLLVRLPLPMALRSDFGSQLQVLRPVVGKAALEDFTFFGLVPPQGPGSIEHPVRAATWEISGPLRNTTEFKSFPRSVVATSIELTVNLDASPDLKQSKFMLTVKGDAYARD
ncbi:Pilin accessory protein (PilO) [Cupriavidus sp. YR651]|uniref:type 4b pilus protein PilO2 n=1 Tax=Cupriavidus sp. YR651 TaxID=1855315 RepID=UPI000888C25C|nr:type 4b pilus protein PilO2 [Cupriavidus sp. YR651]SDD57378.1 Pilin accessory protein (PilO) [Cupriavidus sp. YR651]